MARRGRTRAPARSAVWTRPRRELSWRAPTRIQGVLPHAQPPVRHRPRRGEPVRDFRPGADLPHRGKSALQLPRVREAHRPLHRGGDRDGETRRPEPRLRDAALGARLPPRPGKKGHLHLLHRPGGDPGAGVPLDRPHRGEHVGLLRQGRLLEAGPLAGRRPQSEGRGRGARCQGGTAQRQCRDQHHHGGRRPQESAAPAAQARGPEPHRPVGHGLLLGERHRPPGPRSRT